MESSKICTSCGQRLPTTEFYWISKASGKLRGQCKSCMRERKREQRDPQWTPACSRCGTRLADRPGSGRRLCPACFDVIYDTRHRRDNGAHRIRLKPCSLCGGPKERFERGKVCGPCRPWLRYAASFRRFGLTPAEYLAIFEAQGGRCYVCGALPGATRLCIDHDHSITPIRAAIRGLLCDECNYSRLPRFAENADMLRRAADYLERTPAQQVLSARLARSVPPPPEGLIVSLEAATREAVGEELTDR